MAAPPKSKRSLTRAVLPALAAAGLAGLGTLLVVTHQQGRVPFVEPGPPAGCVIPPPANIGGAFDLIDSAGEPTNQTRFAGAPALVYFGFTHCPDICPTSLYLVEEALTLLGPTGQNVQTALITVDPARDTPDVLAQYILSDGFPERIVGLTGTQPQVDEIIRNFGVTALKGEPEEGGGYNIGHTSFLYVMDGAWNLKGIVSTIGKTPQEVADCIRMSLGATADH